MDTETFFVSGHPILWTQFFSHRSMDLLHFMFYGLSKICKCTPISHLTDLALMGLAFGQETYAFFIWACPQ